MQTSVTDENSKVLTTYFTGTNFGKSADPNYWRPYAVTDQLGNPTTFSYPNATAGESTLLLNSNASVVDNRIKVDGFGRQIVGQTEQGPGANYNSVETDYDIAGRIYKTTMPYAAVADALCTGTCPGITTTYDALGRPQLVTDGGNGTLSYSYNWNDVLQAVGPAPTGEHTKQKQLAYDALGRLTSVCEVTSAAGSGACGQKNLQTGFLTQYTYNILGNRTAVTQNAQTGSSGTQSRTYTFDMIGRTLSEADPETGTVTYKYDTADATCGSYVSAGDVVEKTDAMGNVTCLNYDALHRMTSITYGGTGSYSSNTDKKYFVYDVSSASGFALSNTGGRLAEAYTCPPTGSCATKKTDLVFSYSARGEMQDVWESTPNSGGYYHVNATYFAHGATNALSGIPGLPTIYYGGNNDSSGLDGEGRLLKVTASSGQSPLVNSVTYNNGAQTTQPIGALTGVVLGSTTAGTGDSDTFSFDFNTGRLTSYVFSMGATPQTQTGTLTWNVNGTLQQLQTSDQINAANSQTCGFGYDDLIRITSANCGSVWSQTFGFDPFGNLSKSGSSSFLPTYTGTAGTSTLPTNQYYSIPGGASGVSNYYDANGDLTSDLTHTYAWNADGNNVGVDGSAVTMIYDALDRMIEQTRGSGTKQILYGPQGTKVALMNGQTLVNAFVKLPGGASAVYNSSGLSYYRHADHLGSSRLATTPSRTKYYDVAYAPYGEDYNGSGTQDLAFTGQSTDTVSGSWPSNLYDFLMREYRAGQGRWTSPDPAGLTAVDPTNPQSWNRYAYVANNPLALVDPFGLKPCPMIDTTSIDHCGGGGGGDGGSGGSGGSGGDIFGDWFGYIYIPDYDREGTLVGYIPFLLLGGGGFGGGTANLGMPCLAVVGPLAVGQSRCAANNANLRLVAKTDCSNGSMNRDISYQLEDLQGNAVTNDYVIQQESNPSRTGNTQFGPQTSYESNGAFNDGMNAPMPWFAANNSIQTFFISPMSQPKSPSNMSSVLVRDASGNDYSALGVWMSSNQIFVNGKLAPSIAPCP